MQDRVSVDRLPIVHRCQAEGQERIDRLVAQMVVLERHVARGHPLLVKLLLAQRHLVVQMLSLCDMLLDFLLALLLPFFQPYLLFIDLFPFLNFLFTIIVFLIFAPAI